MRLFSTFLPLVVLSASCILQEVSALSVSHDDEQLQYIGRWQVSAEGAKSAWSASAVTIRFEGTDLNVRISDNGKNFWQVIVNGEPRTVLDLESGEHLYEVVTDLKPGTHTVTLFKRTEAAVGVTEIRGFELNDGGKLLSVERPARAIEVIGDSISCGYGNIAAGKEERFTPATEDAYQTYGAITARAFSAGYTCIAWSGKKLWPDNTIVSLYDRVLPNSASAPKWQFDQQIPDVVLINLGTNDFNRNNPEEDGWVEAYKDFIVDIRAKYPEARIYIGIGPMMSDAWPKGNQALTTVRGYIARVITELDESGEKNVAVIDFGTQKPQNGYGADWHPSVKTHELMAEKFIAQVREDLGW